MDRTPVRNRQFATFVGETGYLTEAEQAGEGPVWFGGEWRMVKGVCWKNPTGKDLPADFDEHPVTMVTLADAQAYCEWQGYRLPTEDEWEHAAMGGSDKRFCFGDDPKYARYFAHCAGRRPDWVVAGSHMPSFYGLFDMHGGVWEWTSTLYTPDETVFVVKGGAVYSPEIRCRSAQRNFTAPNQEAPYWGFRLIMELGDES